MTDTPIFDEVQRWLAKRQGDGWDAEPTLREIRMPDFCCRPWPPVEHTGWPGRALFPPTLPIRQRWAA
jgi:hypothetical protein